MKEIDFLDAVGRVNHKYIEECITYTPPKRMNVWIRRMSTMAACFLVIIGAVLIINHLNQPVIIDENGFYIEDGVLLRYTGADSDITIPDEVKTIADFAFLDQFFLGIKNELLGVSEFIDSGDHREHDSQLAVYRCFQQSTDLSLEDIFSV